MDAQKKYEICHICKKARKARGLTLMELSRQSGLNKNYLSDFENGKYKDEILQEYYAFVLYPSETKAIQSLVNGGI